MTIGHLDQEGLDILDRKLKENKSIEEIVAFFSNYKPKLLQLKIAKSKIILETTSQEFSNYESFTLDIENNTETEIIRDQNQTLHYGENTCYLSKIENEKEKEDGDILFEGTSVNNTPDISVSLVVVEEGQTKQKENSDKETKANSKSVNKKRNIFDVLDVENLKKNIPFMHPDRKTHTFRFFFSLFYSNSPSGHFLDSFSTEFMRFVGAWERR